MLLVSRHRRPRRRRCRAGVRSKIPSIRARAGSRYPFDLEPRPAGARGRPGDAKEHFSAIGAVGVVMDAHTGEVVAMTSFRKLQPETRPGQGTLDDMFNRATRGVRAGSTFKPFTLAMAMDSASFGPRADHELPGGAPRLRTSRPRYPPVRPPMLHRRSDDGKLQHRNGADRRQARDGAAKAWLRKMGFLNKADIELKEIGRPLTPGSRWGPFETMTIGFGAGHRRCAAAARDGLCDAVRRRHLPSANDPEGRTGSPVRRRAARVQRRHQLSHALASSPRCDEGNRQEGGRAWLPDRRQDGHCAEDHQRPL